MENKLQNRIEINPEVMTGKPIIKGTRIPVELIIKLLAQGRTFNDILEDYPNLKEEDLYAALAYAAELLTGEETFLLEKEKMLKFLI